MESFTPLADAPEPVQPLTPEPTAPQPMITAAEAELMSTADLRAAMRGEPIQPQAEPQQQAEGWTIGTTLDGKVEIKLDTGQRWIAKDTNDALQQLAKAQLYSQRHVRQLGEFKQQYDAWRASQNPDAATAPQIPALEPQISPEEEAKLYQQFARDAVMSPELKQELVQELQSQVAANLLGTTPELAPQATRVAMETIQAARNQQVEYDFYSRATDFYDTPENVAAMQKYIQVQPGQQVESESLVRAWQIAVYRGEATPAPKVNQPTPRTPPPAMPSSGIGSQAPDMNPYTMPKDQLRKLMEDELRGM